MKKVNDPREEGGSGGFRDPRNRKRNTLAITAVLIVIVFVVALTAS